MNAVIKLFPNVKVRYTFIDRNKHVYDEKLVEKIKDEIDSMQLLRLKANEKKFIVDKLGHFLPQTYFDFLSNYKYNSDEVTVYIKDKQLYIEIVGYWYRTILWEVPLLAIVSELTMDMENNIDFLDDKLDKISEKSNFFMKYNCRFSDFGTR
jgi:nicotinate phosphoribosyltransferase